jgi:hypothetical protein
MAEEGKGMFKEMKWSVVIGVLIIIVSLTAAFVCFSIMASSAEASLQEWKLGGAFAGFVFTAGLLSSITLQFYNRISADETEKYRVLSDELRLKLLKGSEAPPGYNVDVDEKFKLIFARPGQWTPLKGILYQYIDKEKTGFATNFNVTYSGFDEISAEYTQRHLGTFNPDSPDLEKLYGVAQNVTLEELKNSIRVEEKSLTTEWISVDQNRSQKYIHTYFGQLNEDSPRIEMCQIGVYIYVNRLKGLYVFTFSDSKDEFLKSSEIFNTIINSIRFI